MYRASQGSLSEIGNVSQRVVRNLPDGTFELSDLKTILLTHGPNWPTMTLVCVENTHTMMGGRAVSVEWMENLGTLCHEYGIPIHLDGARLINASAALGTSPMRLTQHCSSATFCLNKGLGAPGGCVITGNSDFIERATLVRKSLGGVIHQAGVLAAACIYGLNNFVSRISKDHSNARSIAKAICAVNSSAVTVDVSSVQTNVVHMICDNIRVNPDQLCSRMGRVFENEALDLSEGVVVKCSPIQPNIVRIMTHGDLLMEDVRAVIRKLQFVIAEYDNCFLIEYDVTETC
ncbi:UNVERIFIED_CONTAM: hypothetical protein GTU68_002438 [Idotea baltica]|nr:hypothetical protein [Idotea baltica]